MNLVRVALDVPVATLFDYTVKELHPELLGARVVVPFGRGKRAGVIIEVGGEPQVSAARIKPVSEVFADEPRLPPDVVQLVQFASRYYRFPIGQVVIGALPQQLRRARPSRREEPWFSLSAVALAADWSKLPPRAINLRRVLEYLRGHGAANASALRSLAPGAARAMRDLSERGWLEQVVKPDRVDRSAATQAPILTVD
jgi:primosomal protein N' (replication factor Y) (superfamily II helicase)